MSSNWDEATRRSAIANGMSAETIDQIEAGIDARRQQQTAAALAEVTAAAVAAQRSNALRTALAAYDGGDAEPGTIASWLEQNAGPAEAAAFVSQWREDLGETGVPATPDEWETKRRTDAALLEQAAALDAQRQAVSESLDATDRFFRQNPGAKEYEPRIAEKIAQLADAVQNGVAQPRDLHDAFASAYKESRVEGAVADFAESNVDVFRPTLHDGLAKPGEAKTRLQIEAEMAAARERRRVEIYADNRGVIDAHLAPLRSAEAEAEAATESFTRRARTWDDALVKPNGGRGGKTASELKAASQAAAPEKARTAASRFEADPAAGFRSAAIDSEQAARTNERTLEQQARFDEAATPKSAWFYDA